MVPVPAWRQLGALAVLLLLTAQQVVGQRLADGWQSPHKTADKDSNVSLWECSERQLRLAMVVL